MTTFSEVQRFRQGWLMALLAIVVVTGAGPLSVGLFQQLVTHRPYGFHPMSDGRLIISTVISVVACLAIVWLIFSAQLLVDVRDDALFIRFFPFVRGRSIPYSEICQAAVRHYSAIREYGGWGVRYGRNGKAYNVSGNWGVQLELASGEKLLLGSQRADELAAAIEASRRA